MQSIGIDSNTSLDVLDPTCCNTVKKKSHRGRDCIVPRFISGLVCNQYTSTPTRH